MKPLCCACVVQSRDSAAAGRGLGRGPGSQAAWCRQQGPRRPSSCTHCRPVADIADPLVHRPPHTMATNPPQLFLLADHVKLSLLERQRAVSLNLPSHTQDSQISRSLEQLRSGIEALESQVEDTSDECAQPCPPRRLQLAG